MFFHHISYKVISFPSFIVFKLFADSIIFTIFHHVVSFFSGKSSSGGLRLSKKTRKANNKKQHNILNDLQPLNEPSQVGRASNKAAPKDVRMAQKSAFRHVVDSSSAFS